MDNSEITKRAVNTFIVESRECLQNIETDLMKIEKGEDDDELIKSIFRSMHTIKGSSGMFGFEHTEKFTHVIENLLDIAQKEKNIIDQNMISLLLECNDHIESFLDLIENTENDSPGAEMLKTGKILLERLNEYLPSIIKEDKQTDREEVVTTQEASENDGKSVENKRWHISLRFDRDIFRNGLDPGSYIKYLNNLGEIKNIATISSALPSIEELDSQSCYLGFEIDFKGDVSKEKIEDVFEFYIEDCKIRILPPESKISDYESLIKELPENNYLIGEILTKIGSLTEHELKEALDIQQELNKDEPSGKLIGDIVVDEQMVQKPVLDAALKKQESIRKKQSSMRIDSGKIDSMINIVGELVINGANVKQLAEADVINKSSLIESVSVMTRLIENIRDTTMSMCMVPIGDTVKRFERIVRELSRERGKEIDLVINGGETELDKSLIEKITDPLMHLIRNSIDHGINNPEERVKKGKSRRGRITLNAYHETGNVVIEILDDGDGLKRDKILSKAIEQGLIDHDQEISDNELYQLIFKPGFSTADVVTNISGRGVGMDVVKKNIEALRGSVYVESEQGKGTAIHIHLPLTLSIIDGFLFQVGESYYVLPLDIVVECTEREQGSLCVNDGGNYTNLRGEVLPLMNLREFFHETGDVPEIANIIVVRYKGAFVGLVVDKLVGEFQTVIKPLGEIFEELKWISGVTILGTGEVAIILDMLNLISNMDNIETKKTNVA